MKRPSLLSQIVAVISRRTPAFQPAPGQPRTFSGALHQTLHPHRPPALPQRTNTDDTPPETATNVPLGRDTLRPGANLTGANLRGKDLRGANLTRANLTRANLTGANLTLADLTLADLTDANLIGAHLSRALLIEAHLTGANLRSAHLTEAHMNGANLAGANLTWANLTEANLTGANLTGANLRGAHLRGANLTEAHLNGADLGGAILTDARFRIMEPSVVVAVLAGVRWSEKTIWPSEEIAATVAQRSRLLDDGYHKIVDEGQSRDHDYQPSTPTGL